MRLFIQWNVQWIITFLTGCELPTHHFPFSFLSSVFPVFFIAKLLNSFELNYLILLFLFCILCLISYRIFGHFSCFATMFWCHYSGSKHHFWQLLMGLLSKPKAIYNLHLHNRKSRICQYPFSVHLSMHSCRRCILSIRSEKSLQCMFTILLVLLFFSFMLYRQNCGLFFEVNAYS